MKNMLFALGLVLVFFTSSAASVAWSFANKTFAAGDTVEVPFIVSGFSSIAAFQFTLKWDTAALNIRSGSQITVTGALPGYGIGCFSWHGKPGFALKPGEIRTLYSTSTGKTLASGTAVFSVWFVAKKSGTVCAALALWNKAPLWSIAYNNDLSPVAQTVGCSPPPAPAQNIAVLGAALREMSITPNPVTDSARIGVDLARGPLLVTVYDAAGYTVFGRKYDHPGGSAFYDIAFLGSAGVYFVIVESTTGRLIEKVLKQ